MEFLRDEKLLAVETSEPDAERSPFTTCASRIRRRGMINIVDVGQRSLPLVGTTAGTKRKSKKIHGTSERCRFFHRIPAR